MFSGRKATLSFRRVIDSRVSYTIVKHPVEDRRPEVRRVKSKNAESAERS